MALMTKAELDAIANRIRPHGHAIKASADAGSKQAKLVLASFTMLRRRAEVGTGKLCSNALDAWLEEHDETKGGG